MHVRAAERLRVDLLAGRRAHQRRAAEEHPALIAHDDGMIGHRRHVGAARRAGAVHHRDLRDALRRQPRLIEEDASEVIAIGEHLVLLGQERAAALHQIDARQRVLAGDLLRAQVLLDGERIVGAALHRRVVRHDHAWPPAHPADAGDEPRARQIVVVDAMRGERRQLEERRARDRAAHPRARRARSLPACACLARAASLPPSGVALEQPRAAPSPASAWRQRLAANSGERMSIFETILAIVHSGCRERAQNCRTVRLSNDLRSDDNGVRAHARCRLPRVQFRSGRSHRRRARSGAPLRRGAHRAARQRDRPQQRVSARSVARARRARTSRA